MKYIYLSIIVVACCLLTNCSKSKNTQSVAVIEKPIPEKLMESQNIKEISNLLNGTTWHYTEDLTTSEIGGWLKVKFNNGQFVTYYATPQDGKWTEGGRGKYEVSEGRYANTGEKYYAVSWEGKMMFDRLDLPCEMVMTIGKKGFQLNVTSSVFNAMKAITMGVNEAAYYAATHKDQVFSGRMEFGDYEWK